MDFPGTIAVAGDTIIRYVTDIGLSLAHHGFRKILLVNGHGSNVPFLDVAARNITNETEAVCAMVSWWSLIPKTLFAELRESGKARRDGAWVRTGDFGTAASAAGSGANGTRGEVTSTSRRPSFSIGIWKCRPRFSFRSGSAGIRRRARWAIPLKLRLPRAERDS